MCGEAAFPTGHRDPAESDIILCNGSNVKIGGARCLSLKRGVARCELIHGNARQVFCSDVDALVHPPGGIVFLTDLNAQRFRDLNPKSLYRSLPC
jgi:hypothetical protein